MRLPSTLSTVPIWTPSAPMTSMCSLISAIETSSHIGAHELPPSSGSAPVQPACGYCLLHCFLDRRLRSAGLPRLVTDLIVLPTGHTRPVLLASAATLLIGQPDLLCGTQRLGNASGSAERLAF